LHGFDLQLFCGTQKRENHPSVKFLQESLQALILDLQRRQDAGETHISINPETLLTLHRVIEKNRPKPTLQVLFNPTHRNLADRILATAGLSWSENPGSCVLCFGAQYAGIPLLRQPARLNEPIILSGITYIPTIDLGTLAADNKNREAKRVVWEGVLATMGVMGVTPTPQHQSLFL
jgi:hypothetical protein